MPEGPEVKIITEQLQTFCINHKILEIKSIGGRFVNKSPKGLNELVSKLPLMISSINCKGKFIYWTLEQGMYIWNTLGMTGEWSMVKSKHTAIEFVLDNGSIHFNDPRHFGTIKFAEEVKSKLDQLGPDMLSSPPSQEIFDSLILGHSGTIVEALMNQEVVSGVGNYVKAESLYRAAISPWRNSKSLGVEELKLLRLSIISVLQESYSCKGATLATYKNVLGEMGTFGDNLKVYKKKIDPSGNEVVSEETKDKRTTWWVKNIQK